MKKFLFVLVAIGLVVGLAGAVSAQADDRYAYITSTDDGDYYVDKIALQDAIALNSAPVEVWVKLVGSEMFLRSLTQQYPKLVYYSGWYMLQRIQLNQSQFKLLSYFIYADSGELLVSYQYRDPQWQEASPISVPGIILHKMIKQFNNKDQEETGN